MADSVDGEIARMPNWLKRKAASWANDREVPMPANTMVFERRIRRAQAARASGSIELAQARSSSTLWLAT